MTRAAIYARFSSDLQRDASIEDQVRVCTALVERLGATVVQVFSDYSASGASNLRPGFQQMLAAVRSGSVDLVVAEALDRLSRDQEHVAGLYKQLQFAGTKLVTVGEGEISELHVGLKGTMNALFLKDLGQKTHRGLEGRVRQGRAAGGKAYGYRIVRELDARGDAVRGGRAIEPIEAAIVNRIFREFATGQSPRAIAKTLNAEGIAGPDGGVWQDTTIRGHAGRGTGILRNQLYIGQLIWNRMRFIKDPATGKRVSRPNPQSEWVIEAVPDLRIIDQDLWDRVDVRLVGIRASDRSQLVRANEFWKQRRPKHVLSGKTFCACCGGIMAAVGRDYLACSTARNKGTCDQTGSVRRVIVEGLVLDALKSELMQPDLVKEFAASFIAETNRLRGEAQAGRSALEREQAQVERKLTGLIDAIADGFRASGLQAQLDQLEGRKVQLARQLAERSRPLPLLHPNLAELYRSKVGDLQTALNDPSGQTEATESLRSLIERVVIGISPERGLEVELIGELSAMLAFGQAPDSKKPARYGAGFGTERLSSVKLVAGTGFEPVTFRL